MTVELNADQTELTVDDIVQTEMVVDFPVDGTERKAVLRLKR